MSSPDLSTLETPSALPAPDVQITRHALRGGVAMASAQIVKIAVQFLSIVVLSRLLSPEDFGLVAAIAPVIAFVTLFQDLGMQQAVVQRATLSHEQKNDVFWVTAALALACCVVVVLASPGVAWFYGDRRLMALTAAAGLPLLLGCTGTLPVGLLNRDMQFKRLAVLDVASSLLGFAATAIAAWMGMGYWSLLLTPMVTTLVMVGGAWTGCGWRPDAPRWRGIDREIVAFGANLTGFSFMNYFSRNLDNILIGRASGAIELGYYDRAYKLLLFPLQNINAPLARVMVPLMSRLQENKVELKRVYLVAVRYLTFLVVPGMAGAITVSPELVELLFGPRWAAVAPIFTWLGVAGLLQPLNNSTGWIFISQGHTRTMFRWGMYSAFSTILSFIVGLQWGAVGVAAAYAISDYLTRTPFLWMIVGRVGPVRLRDMLMIQMPLLAAAGGTWLLVQYGLRTQLQGIPLIAAAIGISYLLAILLTASHAEGRNMLGTMLKKLRRA